MTKNTTAIKETQHSTNAHSKEITGFVPTQDELIHLLKHWVKQVVDEQFFAFGCECCGSYDLERNRINEIAQILGDEETDRAVKKAYEEAAQDFDKSDWIVFRYGTQKEQTAYQDKGGQALSDFECGLAEEIARKVVQRVFRGGAPEQQQTLLKDELARYAKKLHSYKRGWRRHVEIFGISFPAELRTFVDDPHPEPTGLFGTLSIEQGKALLVKLDETAKKGEVALEALVAGHGERS